MRIQQSQEVYIETHPLFLTAQAGDADSPRWHEATSGENAEGFWKAMWMEIMTLQEKDCWEQVPREEVTQKIVKLKWAFKMFEKTTIFF